MVDWLSSPGPRNVIKMKDKMKEMPSCEIAHYGHAEQNEGFFFFFFFFFFFK